MFQADPLTIAQFTIDAGQMALQAGPPADLPGQVPSFVGEIFSEVGSTAGDAAGGLGETISELTPGGAEVSDGANSTASDAAENAPGR